ncbi:hypothetical protein HXX25_00935 [Hyphobacterium sp. CCMP332]|uniref:hypothetical protein n=1 Tax=Hyphobacterium sp. CCMP332 TaxID=2749086 RepID=UPI00164EF1AB|nr:hypothetical protein [Hyphobacterium sp. CCMP332]QNL18027.1 hypothetical protein HXX25_00935 [Hyphobacterium sp. CCMP332]
MAIERKKNLLGQAGVTALLIGLAACSPMNEGEGEGERATPAGGEGGGYSASAGEGEGEGESGEGSAGGEFGIKADQAAQNPVTYLTALEVMRAHYLAGLAAYDADRRAVAAEMFTHPISEIYVDLEAALIELEAPLFGDELERAAAAPFDGSTDAEIRAAAAAVIAAIDAAEIHAPQTEYAEAAVEAQVLTNMIVRAALQYEFAMRSDAPNGPYLDGYGFFKSAEVIATRHMDEIRELDSVVADALSEAMTSLAAAYPTVLAPEQASVDADELVGLADAASAAAERLE